MTMFLMVFLLNNTIKCTNIWTNVILRYWYTFDLVPWFRVWIALMTAPSCYDNELKATCTHSTPWNYGFTVSKMSLLFGHGHIWTYQRMEHNRGKKIDPIIMATALLWHFLFNKFLIENSFQLNTSNRYHRFIRLRDSLIWQVY